MSARASVILLVLVAGCADVWGFADLKQTSDAGTSTCDAGARPIYEDPCGNCPMSACCVPGGCELNACAPGEASWGCGDTHYDFFCPSGQVCCVQTIVPTPDSTTCPPTFTRQSGTNYDCAATCTGLTLCPWDDVCPALGKTCTTVSIDGNLVGACL